MANENSILDDVKAASDELAGIEAPEAPESMGEAAPVAEAPDKPTDRDDKGRFKPGEKRETLTLKPDATKPVANGKPIAPEKPAAEAMAPPPDWKGDGKLKWNLLPKPIQAELHERYTEVQSQRAELAPIKEIIDANRQEWVNAAGSVQSALSQFAQFHKLYLTRPLDLIQHIARSSGIDLRAAVSGQPQQQAPQQPQDIGKMLDQLVEQRFQPLVAAAEQRETQQIAQSVDEFRADSKHPYFEDVRMQMGHLIRSGAAKDLSEAYDQATWANPQIRQQLIEQANAGKNQQAQVQRARLAQRASVTGAPVNGAAMGAAGNPKATALDDVREAMRELSGG